MYKRRICVLIVCMALVFSAMSGCASNDVDEVEYIEEMEESSEAGYRRTVLYYMSAEGYVVPVMRQIPWEEGIGKAALSYLVANEANCDAAARMGLTALIPDGTEFSLRIGDDGEAVLDLTGYTQSASESEERAMVEAIVNTLAEFPTIDSVRLTLDGRNAKALPHGTRIDGAMSAFALNAEDGELMTSTADVSAMTLYFPNKTGSLNIPVTRYTELDVSFENAMRALIEGPKSDGMLACFPEGTTLNSAMIVDGVAKVDLSSAFSEARYTDGLELAAYETMLLTANAIEEAYALEVYIDGEAYDIAAEASAPLYANEFR